MHWITLPLIISGVAAAAVDQEQTQVAEGEDRDGKCKFFIIIPPPKKKIMAHAL